MQASLFWSDSLQIPEIQENVTVMTLPELSFYKKLSKLLSSYRFNISSLHSTFPGFQHNCQEL